LVTEQHAWLALNAAELPPRTALELLDHYGSVVTLMSCSVTEVARAARLRPGELARFGEAKERDHQPALDQLSRLGARLVTLRDSEYPANLRQLYDPPLVLFVRGSLLPTDERAVAIVGTRRATPYGLMASETLGRDLAARGVTIVSGLAVGADSAAHRGALAGGGRTLGVLACGIDVPYPRDTMELRERMVKQGAVLSEAPLGTPAQRSRFHARNRLISGLSRGVIVTEAPEHSGALITANFAADQGRHVFAVPGSFNSEFSRGAHALIRDGARLVESVEDVLDELQLPELEPPPASVEAAAEPAPPTLGLAGDERAIFETLSLQQRHVDAIIQECRIPPSRASAGLLMLELKGLVRRLPGNMFMRVR
jgi:DNA processing protein